MSRKLSKQQETFATEYVKLGDASAAFRKAYNTSRWKAKTVHERASKLLKTDKVQTRVKELQAEAAQIAKEKFNIDSEELLSHLNILRLSRIDHYVELVEVPYHFEDKEGNNQTAYRKELQFKSFDKLSEEQLMCIESIKHGRNGIELKLHGKDWTIQSIAKHIGFYGEHNHQKNGGSGNPEELKREILELLSEANGN